MLPAIYLSVVCQTSNVLHIVRKEMSMEFNKYQNLSNAPAEINRNPSVQHTAFSPNQVYPSAPQMASNANPPVQPIIVAHAPPPNVLGPVPSMATCPSCSYRGKTIVKFEPNTKTHLIAMLICLVGGLCCCCIPYCKDSCQTAMHNCSNCGTYVGSYQN
ncbi:hypothetical protein KR009_008209 [Drosophila setifemur]|nr:hypothetical protein KR009_008209 [Drosophila setifemur]